MSGDKSRADALTEAQRKALETAVNVLNINWEHETANELWEAFTAPVEQPAAAPIDPRANRGNSVGDWLWCELMDYCKERGMPPTNNDRLFDLVKRARTAWDSQPALSPADERGAFEAALDKRAKSAGFEVGRMTECELDNAWWGWQAARAASANETQPRATTFDEWWASLEGTPDRHGPWFVTMEGDWLCKEDVHDIWKLLHKEPR